MLLHRRDHVMSVIKNQMILINGHELSSTESEQGWECPHEKSAVAA